VPGTTPKTNFVVGDFNGDGSEDLAVVVKPNETKLAEVNSEMANWILEDPKKIVLPSSSLAVPISNKPAPVRAEMAQQSTADKVKTMTKEQWAKLRAEWKKDKAKFTACNDKSKADKLKGRKRWAAIYDCMMQ